MTKLKGKKDITGVKMWQEKEGKRKERREKGKCSHTLFKAYPPLDVFCSLNQTSATSPTISTVGAISEGIINIYGMLAGCRHSL